MAFAQVRSQAHTAACAAAVLPTDCRKGAFEFPTPREAPGLIVELGFWINPARQMLAILHQQRKASFELKLRIDAGRGR
jgi:hypothetical protein